MAINIMCECVALPGECLPISVQFSHITTTTTTTKGDDTFIFVLSPYLVPIAFHCMAILICIILRLCLCE